MNILDEIFASKRGEIAKRKRVKPLAAISSEAEITPAPADFVAALRASHFQSGAPTLIAEVKFASPSKGVVVRDPDPLDLARKYVGAGAAAISVLTDEKYFHGHLEYLQNIHQAIPTVPLLRKDFICDPYQIYEARAAGASAVLLIASYLEPVLLADLHVLANVLDMAALIEVRNQDELEVAMKINGLTLLGVNNRDLRTFDVDLQTCLDLRPRVPDNICFVAESGIHDHEDVCRLSAAGVDAMLIGEALVTSPDVPKTIHNLTGQPAGQITLPGEGLTCI